MHIYKETTYEDNPVSRHVVALVEIRGEYVSVGVNSFNDQNGSFYRILNMPMAAFIAAPYPQCVYNWLVAPGSKFEGGMIVAGDEPSLQEKQASLLIKVEAERDAHIHGGMLVGEKIYDTDADSIRNIQGKAQRAVVAISRDEQNWGTPWKLHDNTMAMLDANGMVGVGEALDDHITACYARSWELKAGILMSDEASIDMIDPTAGWPSIEPAPAE